MGAAAEEQRLEALEGSLEQIEAQLLEKARRFIMSHSPWRARYSSCPPLIQIPQH